MNQVNDILNKVADSMDKLSLQQRAQLKESLEQLDCTIEDSNVQAVFTAIEGFTVSQINDLSKVYATRHDVTVPENIGAVVASGGEGASTAAAVKESFTLGGLIDESQKISAIKAIRTIIKDLEGYTAEASLADCKKLIESCNESPMELKLKDPTPELLAQCMEAMKKFCKVS